MRYLGCYFATFAVDGSTRVWYPRYQKKSRFTNILIPLIQKSLDTAPLDEKKAIGAAKKEWCDWIGYPDDHDASAAMFCIDSDCVTSSSPNVRYAGVDKAIQDTIEELLSFIRRGFKP